MFQFLIRKWSPLLIDTSYLQLTGEFTNVLVLDLDKQLGDRVVLIYRFVSNKLANLQMSRE